MLLNRAGSLGWLTIVLLVLAVPVPVTAGTIYVDAASTSEDPDGSQSDPYPTIQEGINHAEFYGDERVEVAAGTYSESITMADGVDVIGAGAGITIIDGSDRGQSTVAFNSTRFNPRFNGFTITGGTGRQVAFMGEIPVYAGGGIFIFDSGPIITDNIITGNALTEGICRGGGIYISLAIDSPQIMRNEISDNIALSTEAPGQNRGGGIYFSSKSGAGIISENLISNNQSDIGGGIYSINISASDVSISRNTLLYNQAKEGAALFTRDYEDSTTTIVNNLIVGNSGTAGEIDCDDDEALASPGQAEVCADTIDNDCDISTPDIFDADGDGSYCDVDCVDSDPAIYPSQGEHCRDEIDNDCDGSIDLATPENIVMVEFTDPTLYLVNTLDPGIALDWVTTGYDDSGWQEGTFGLGYETDTDGAQDLIYTGVSSSAVSVYTRTTFEINGLSSVNTLFLGADYDDGYVAWINGTEVHRSAEMPSGDPAWNAFPTEHESSNGSAPDYGTLVDISSDGIPVLVEGTNVLAVGIYNDAPGSADLVLVPRLSMSWGTDDPDCLCADNDSDGYACDDCNDGDGSIHPGREDVCNDTIDNDCNVATPDVYDSDSDGFSCAVDCDDSNADVNPAKTEIHCDGLDNDCNPGTPDIVDMDSDFFDCTVDCDESNFAIKPGALEFCFDGVDNNCDGFIDDADLECSCTNPIDSDGDTYRCSDCNDGDPDINPGENELCNDTIDNDCNPGTADIFDGDSDGYLCDADCNDFDADISPAVFEVCNDGIDNDCDGDSDDIDSDDCGCEDLDSDGYACTDCNDGNADINPGSPEICDDGIDNDCDTDGTPDVFDGDSDGVDCNLDCEDGNPAIHPNAPEICDDGYDNDCDGLIDVIDPDMVLVQFGSSMRYLANYTDPGIGITWVQESFDDLPWDNGLYGVGYQVGPPGTGADDLITTDVPDGATSIYTRARFVVTDLDGVNSLWLGADWDDGYVVWINGVEVHRSAEMPPGVPAWDADPELHESSNGLIPSYGSLIDISSDGIPILHEGLNVLAVGIYNDIPQGTYSSDLVIVPRLSMNFGSDDDDCFCADFDKDGYSCSDCDDIRADINPGAAEIGCDFIDNDCDTDGTPDVFDADSDGWDCDVDCADNNPDVNPDNQTDEIPCDFLDNDCDGLTPDIVDDDEDTYNCFDDCDDIDSSVNPGATEIYCDGIDNDCSTLTADIYDEDKDGFLCDVDCDDTDAAVNPDAFEMCLDGIDNDCDGDSDDIDSDDCGCDDLDSDGYACYDCDDAVPTVNPGTAEVCNDTIDNDCDPATLDIDDRDSDGFDCLTDCNDDDPFVRPNAIEICDDGIDNNCDDPDTDGIPDLFDLDSDGYLCNVDCRDFNDAINPGVPEVCDDGIDNDCDVLTPDVFDADTDGYDCTFDCDDDDANVNPGIAEVCNDTIDNDCNVTTIDLFDNDSDGYDCSLDCDDGDAAVSPAAFEKCDDGIDNDCDGDSDDIDSDDCGCDDLDSDGYACQDCDDTSPTTNPAAPELCNDTIDNDCNVATPDIADYDTDGYLCTVDCNDGDPTVNPGAVEICGDAVDNDCDTDGTPDTWDADSDGHACDTDCRDEDPTINPGIIEVGCDEIDNDCDPMTTDLRDGDSDDYACVDTTSRGAGISALAGTGGTTYIVNNTVVGNSLTLGHGGGIWIDDMMATTSSLLANNLVADNSALVAGGIDHTAHYGDLRYNALHNNAPSDLYDGGGSGAVKEGNLFSDPLLTSPSVGNYRLSDISPLIDAADPSFAPQNDLDRFYRPYDGDGDSTAIADIGAFEYPSGEVFDVLFTTKEILTWQVLAADLAFNVYRGSMDILIANGSYTQPPYLPIPEQWCEIAIDLLPFSDSYEPAAGKVVFYMVTTVAPEFEGSLGEDSAGALRLNSNACPESP